MGMKSYPAGLFLNGNGRDILDAILTNKQRWNIYGATVLNNGVPTNVSPVWFYNGDGAPGVHFKVWIPCIKPYRWDS